MGNIQNLRTPTYEEAKEMQRKSVEKRMENKIKRGLIEDAIRKQLTEEDLNEIARNLIERSKKNNMDLVTMRDTIGEKPKEVVDANVELSEIRVELRDE